MVVSYNLSMLNTKLVECVPNFSEGQSQARIKKIVAAAKKVKGVRVLDVEWNADHNRSLMTIVGEPEKVLEAAYKSIEVATKLIDMTKHKGEHPRIGATDVVPFVPVSGVTINECVKLAEKLGKRVAKNLKIPVFLYEAAATSPERVNLADVRKGEYEGLVAEMRKPDFGPSKMHKTAGAVVIGARKYLIAYNVNLDTSDVQIAKDVANAVREKTGGLPGVKALGFAVNGKAQVSMNLVDFEKTNMDEAFRAVEAEAGKRGVKVFDSEIYGMIPLEALVRMARTQLKATGFKAEQVLEKRMYEFE